jgi:nitrate reductase assembly molybdenum cofactor insertion protein NarJ
MRTLTHCLALAEVFRYPGADYVHKVHACHAALAARHPEAATEFERFAAHVAGLDPQAREELYVKTFDVQALCYPDLGFVLFGEDYKRGMFLVHMKAEHARAGTDCGTELPDHVSNVLMLLCETDDEEFRCELAAGVAVPALRKMLEGFDDTRIKARMAELRKKHDAIVQEPLNYGNVYQHALRAALLALEQDFADVRLDLPPARAGVIPIVPEMAAGASFRGMPPMPRTARQGG